MNKTKSKTYYLVCFLLLGGMLFNSLSMKGQESFVVDSLKWEKEKNKCDFSKEITKEEQAERNEEQLDNLENEKPRDFNIQGMSSAFQTFGIIFIVIMVLLLVYFIFQSGGFKRNRSIKSQGEWLEKIEQIEEDLENKDLHQFIKQAIKEGAYRVAIRLQYLLAIQQLNEAEAVVWKRQKTNGEYQKELIGTAFYIDFKKATLTFEFVWYSDTEFTSSSLSTYYNSIAENVDAILMGIKQENDG